MIDAGASDAEPVRLTTRGSYVGHPAWVAGRRAHCLRHRGRRVAFGGVDPDTGKRDVWSLELETLELEHLTDDPAFDGVDRGLRVTRLRR